MSGDATLISATDLRVAFNERVILDGASLSILDGDRVGLVGRNGSGKSTFIRILADLATPDSGTVSRRKDLVVGYLSQDFTLDSSKNVYENVKSGAQEVLDLIEEFEGLPADSHRHSEIEERIRILDGWDLEHRIATAMSQLHCPASDRAIDALSGGEKRRVALCRAIISRPDLLILDEPTNHLDNESIEWLADYLEHYPSAFLLVTHDRYFLERCINRMVELADGTFWSHSGTYADYLEAKASRQATAELVEHKRQVALKREWEWYRTGPRAQRTKSKIRMAAHERAVEEKAPEFEKDVDLVIPPPPPLGNRVAELANVGMEFGGRQLFSGVSLKFAGGQRIGITGRNGLGKTTLLKILLGEIKPTEGEARVGPLTRFNYVDQARLQLDPEATVLDAVGDGTEFVVFGEGRLSLRAYLKRFLFNDDRLVARVKHLSGGERSRLLLARILKRGGNFLILDEPTNDLDLPTLRVLEEALLQFPGVVLMVSHDRYFLNRVSTDILAFEGGGRVAFSSGNYDYYLEKRQRQEAPVRTVAPISQVKGAKPAVPKSRKLTFKEQKELEGMEAAILVAETRVTELEGRFADPDFHRKHGAQTADLTRELETARAETARLFARWEELEAVRQASA